MVTRRSQFDRSRRRSFIAFSKYRKDNPAHMAFLNPPSLDARTRGRKLMEERRLHFAKFPLCVRCLQAGVIRVATELDHIHALARGGKDNGPKQGLCKPCHVEKTAEDMGFKKKVRIGLDGFPVDDSKSETRNDNNGKR